MKLTITLLFGLLIGMVKSLPVNQHNKRRPVPTDKLPLPVLPEDPDKDYDPKPSDINDFQLIERLGVNYLPEFMSPTMPRHNNHTVMHNPLVPRTSPEIRKLAKTLVRSLKGKRRNKKSKRLLRKVQTQIAQYTACPVRYRWKDLGIRFWPRFVKEGYCDTSQSCSIPSGMHCRPVDQTTINILRWYCQGIFEQKYCLWVDVKYPITSECKCQC
uniref:Noggin protein n=1 Tax=Phallusia mammillata TaxID=59560 RepID=A0A6F9DMH7_9ASCI|nr:noggin protein precursor [Phallusia mammillata]